MLLERVSSCIRPGIDELGCELLGCELSGRGSATLLRIYIDSPGGVSVDDCMLVGNRIRPLLDVELEADFKGDYELEISSPGVERPLFTLAHYERFIGKPVNLRLREKMEGSRSVTGLLQAVSGGEIVLEVDGQTWKCPFQAVLRGWLAPKSLQKG